MTWSFHAVGRPAGVLKKLEELPPVPPTAPQPEASLRGSMELMVRRVIDASDPALVLSVQASASQSPKTTDGHRRVRCTIKIDYLANFAD